EHYSSNGLNGSIPTTLGKLNNLVNLDLEDNLLSGTIPAWLGANTQRNIRLHGNNMTGSISSSLGNLTNLVNFELQKNLLSGPIPAFLAKSRHYELWKLFYPNKLLTLT
ncbi:hypothetical protein EJB05_27795, partial [Eragrostis curvula]